MNIKFTTHSNTLIASVSGELDQHKASTLREQIDLKITHTNVKNLIFDFSALDFMDSSGIGVIIGRYKLMRAIGGHVYIVTDRQSVKKIIELSGLTRIVSVFTNLSDALKSA